MSEAIRTHQPCDDCGSSDALAIYSDHTHCFSCGKTRRLNEEDRSRHVDDEGGSRPASELLRGSYGALAKRRITEETCRFWSYIKADFHGQHVQVAQYLDNNRRVVAQKVRLPTKEFTWVGKRKQFKGLYGQWLWRDGGKQVVITEGELDALSVSQAQQNKYAVVSLVDGAGSAEKGIKEALPWLEKFERIILWFDNDEEGRKAVDKVKKLLPPGKAYITWAPEGYKDASDLMQAGKSSLIVDCVFSAKQWVPEALVSGQKIIERLKARPVVPAYPYPEILGVLNHMTGGGIRLGELDTWTSGSGMGKTTIIKMLQWHYFHTTDFCQALIHLEEPLEDTGDDLIAYEVGQRFQIDNPEFKNTREYEEAALRLFTSVDANGNPRFQLYDAFGSVEDESLYSTIRYLATAYGVKIFWLDHLSILVSDMDQDGDERRRIDALMSNLKKLTVELNIYIGLISHLKKPVGASQGRTFETGLVPTLDDLRGSGGIKQLSNGVFALSRNQQAENPLARNTSTITVLKCRKTGRTGTADYVLFDEKTGRFVKGMKPDLYPDHSDNGNSSANDDY
ncbi:MULTISPECIES: DnaB-like helicase C-terminal domain-containing protein [unclassified Aminobacter]|uniref:DnaB-like helicase C-terminal domain-containing protein n=1 Tax=unclassified Aminobacter TaxID=2644704 RepID=UPI000A0548C2|nr:MULTISPECIES: DnaB-like helicase C-terminal domain-containing protein [unclassified Aminobacter]TWH35571.1 twinkle protein [Aminobacter sp. J15]